MRLDVAENSVARSHRPTTLIPSAFTRKMHAQAILPSNSAISTISMPDSSRPDASRFWTKQVPSEGHRLIVPPSGSLPSWIRRRTSRGVHYLAIQRKRSESGEPARSRTENQQIKRTDSHYPSTSKPYFGVGLRVINHPIRPPVSASAFSVGCQDETAVSGLWTPASARHDGRFVAALVAVDADRVAALPGRQRNSNVRVRLSPSM